MQGIVCATVLMVVIALANVYTNDILLWQAHAVRRKDYETLSEVRRQLYMLSALFVDPSKCRSQLISSTMCSLCLQAVGGPIWKVRRQLYIFV